MKQASQAGTKTQSDAKPIRRTQKERSEESRAALLRSARIVLARDGFEAARIEDIARDAGYSRGTFYVHYKTKDELFADLIMSDGQRVASELQALFEQYDQPEKALASVCDYYVNCLEDQSSAILSLEYKLYLLRNPQQISLFAAVEQKFHSGIQKQMNLAVDQDRFTSSSVVLEAVVVGLCLELSSSLRRISKQQAALLLRRTFDCFVREKLPLKEPLSDEGESAT